MHVDNTPLPSNRHHRSSGDWLEGMRENYQVCSVQYCAQQLCIVQCTHIWTDLTVLWIGFCLTGPISLCLDSLWSCGFFFLLLSFFPRLISAVGDWMSTKSPYFHTWCGPSVDLEIRMQVWNVLHAARWKYRSQKVAKNRRLCTIAQICRAISSKLRHVSTIGK